MEVDPADRMHLTTGPGGRESASPAHVTLEGGAEIDYRGRVLLADKIDYDRASGDVTLTGHVVLNDGVDDVRVEASHGEYNVHTQTGHRGLAVWVPERVMEIAERANHQVDKVFPVIGQNYLYLHPVKLSRWNVAGPEAGPASRAAAAEPVVAR